MTREEIIATLSEPTPGTLDLAGPMFDAFVVEMKDRKYGFEALCAAWNWFVSGWDARATFDGYH